MALTTLDRQKGWTDKKRGSASHLFFSPEFIEHILDLQFPVVLQGVKGVLRHLFLHLLLQGRQLRQNGAEIGSAVGILVPALCQTGGRQRPKVRDVPLLQLHSVPSG